MKKSDIRAVPAGPDSPIYRGGLRMNAIQRPAKSDSDPRKNLTVGETEAAPNSQSPLSENTNQTKSKGGR